MQILLGIVEQSIALLGLIISVLIDGYLVAGYLHGKPHQIDFERIIRPISIFFVALLVCKVVIWIT